MIAPWIVNWGNFVGSCSPILFSMYDYDVHLWWSFVEFFAAAWALSHAALLFSCDEKGVTGLTPWIDWSTSWLFWTLCWWSSPFSYLFLAFLPPGLWFASTQHVQSSFWTCLQKTIYVLFQFVVVVRCSHSVSTNLFALYCRQESSHW